MTGATPVPESPGGRDCVLTAVSPAGYMAGSGTAGSRIGDVDAGIVALWQAYGRERSAALRDRLVLHYAPLVKYVAGRVGTGPERLGAPPDRLELSHHRLAAGVRRICAFPTMGRDADQGRARSRDGTRAGVARDLCVARRRGRRRGGERFACDVGAALSAAAVARARSCTGGRRLRAVRRFVQRARRMARSRGGRSCGARA